MHMVCWISTVCYYHLPRIYRCMTKTTGDVIRPVSLRTSWWNHMNGQLRKAKKYAERSHWVLLQVSLVRRLSVCLSAMRCHGCCYGKTNVSKRGFIICVLCSYTTSPSRLSRIGLQTLVSTKQSLASVSVFVPGS